MWSMSVRTTRRYAPAHTIIAHGDIRNNLLQDRLPLRKLLVLGLRRLQLGAEFLQRGLAGILPRNHASRTWILPRWKNLASWPPCPLILRYHALRTMLFSSQDGSNEQQKSKVGWGLAEPKRAT